MRAARGRWPGAWVRIGRRLGFRNIGFGITNPDEERRLEGFGVQGHYEGGGHISRLKKKKKLFWDLVFGAEGFFTLNSQISTP